MNIVDDIVVFANTDILGFSSGMQAAIASEGAGPEGVLPVAPEQVLSGWVNQYLTQILERYATKVLPSFDALQVAFTKASEADQLVAKAFLDQAKAVLGVDVTDPVITPK